MAVPAREGTELERALTALDRLPFVGLVEAFGPSAQALQEHVQVVFPDFRALNDGEFRQLPSASLKAVKPFAGTGRKVSVGDGGQSRRHGSLPPGAPALLSGWNG